MSAEYIRRYYGVPAKKGMEVTVDGNLGVITGYRQQYLLVRPVAYPEALWPCHPAWRVTYHTKDGPVSFGD